MKLNFTRKTWYFFLLASAAVSMLNGFFVLAGQTFGLLEQIAFCLAAIAALFLAAEKGSPAKDKRNYFLVFLLLLFSYMINGWLGYLCSALAWPALLLVEYQHGKPIQRAASAGGHLGSPPPAVSAPDGLRRRVCHEFLDQHPLGAAGLRRGWAALALYKGQEETV